VNQVSAQLQRLEAEGVVEKVPWVVATKTAFQIAERFFNIWYLMRASRRVRRRFIWLVKFLEAWFGEQELETRGRDLLAKEPEELGRARYAATAFAYAQAVRDRRLRLDLEDAALRAVEPDSIRQLVDLTACPPAYATAASVSACSIRCAAKVMAMPNLNPDEFWRLLAGSPHYTLREKESIVDRLPALAPKDLAALEAKLARGERKLLQMFPAGRVRTLFDLLSTGKVADVYDYEAFGDCLEASALSEVAEVALSLPYWPQVGHHGDAACRVVADENDHGSGDRYDRLATVGLAPFSGG